MTEEKQQYCVEMVNVPKQKEEHTIPLVLIKDKPLVLDSIDKTVEVAETYKQWHPKIDFQVRKYFGENRYHYEIELHGTWKISEEILKRI